MGHSPAQWDESLADAVHLMPHGNKHLFDAILEGHELLLHVIDPSHPSGMRSWRFFDGVDVTEEEM